MAALAAGQFQIIEDGRVCLSPVSLAVFGKNKGDGRFVEINTVRANTAYLKFDRLVRKPFPTSAAARLTEAELVTNIEVVNNRRTIERTDDLFIHIAQGPVYYREDKHSDLDSWTRCT